MNVFVLGAIQSAIDVYQMISDKTDLAGYIGLSDRFDRSKDSAYVNAKEHISSNYFEVHTYNLSAQEDKALLESLSIDVLIVAGWQRLIPEWLINHCRVCAVGIHGSPLGINKGRGRSPQNWALLMGMKLFEVSLFKITPGVDDGEIILSRSFNYSISDNIRTSYVKVTICVADMLVEAISNNLFEKKGEQQNDSEAEYLPQRIYDDGEIDWDRNADDLVNFIRALTKPYPGAYSKLGDRSKLCIWTAVPFDSNIGIFQNKPAGTVLSILEQKELLIKCKDSLLIITDYSLEGEGNIYENLILPSVKYKEQIENIKRRHIEKYPNLPLSNKLL